MLSPKTKYFSETAGLDSPWKVKVNLLLYFGSLSCCTIQLSLTFRFSGRGQVTQASTQHSIPTPSYYHHHVWPLIWFSYCGILCWIDVRCDRTHFFQKVPLLTHWSTKYYFKRLHQGNDHGVFWQKPVMVLLFSGGFHLATHPGIPFLSSLFLMVETWTVTLFEASKDYSSMDGSMTSRMSHWCILGGIFVDQPLLEILTSVASYTNFVWRSQTIRCDKYARRNQKADTYLFLISGDGCIAFWVPLSSRSVNPQQEGETIQRSGYNNNTFWKSEETRHTIHKKQAKLSVLFPAPCQPTAISADLSCANSTAYVTWVPVTAALQYQACAQSTDNDPLCCLTTKTFCTVVGLQCGSTYNFSVQASNEVCRSSFSQPYSKGAGSYYTHTHTHSK